MYEGETLGSAAHGQRVPNRLGEGERLRQDILDTATRILEESGREDALSLRGIAREVGIAAPSIYLHFKNKTDLIWTVLDTAYSALASLMSEAERQAAGTGADAWERLSAAADAYRRYAVDNPRRYRLMFSLEQQASVQRHATEHHPLTRVLHAWTEAVERYLTDACPQRREEAQTMATLLWTGMHGQFALWHTLPHPFAEDDAILVELQQALMRRLLLPSE